MYKHYSNTVELPFHKAQEILQKYYKLGAKKLTLLGGEPMLHPNLEEIAKFAKDLGYSYVRIQTNGQFDPEILQDPLILNNVDTFSFSVDGPDERKNSIIRIRCSLDKTLQNIKVAQNLGYDTRIAVTVTSLNINDLFDIVKLSEKVGVSVVYLNLVFPMGSAKGKTFLEVSPNQWLKAYRELKKHSQNYKVKIKLPIGYSSITPNDHKCIALELSRLYIMPNGDAYPCVLFIDKPNLKISEKGYINKIINYVNTSVEELNNRCYMLFSQENELKPLCLYYREILGGTGENERKSKL